MCDIVVGIPQEWILTKSYNFLLENLNIFVKDLIWKFESDLIRS